MGTCGCHWAGGCRRTGRAYAPLHCSLAAALTVMGLRHQPQSAAAVIAHGYRSRAQSRQWGRRPQYEVHLRYPAPLAFRSQGLANAESWQDLRAVHDSRGPCSEKGPFLARSSRGVSSNGGLRGFSDAWRAHLAKASSFWMHGGDMLPRRGPFPRPRPFLGYTGAKYCHRQTPGNA